MYNNLPKIRTFREPRFHLSLPLIAFSVMFISMYVWEKFISQPIEPSSLNKTEGIVVDKITSRHHRSGKTYSFRIQTDEGVKRFRINKGSLSECCAMDKVPMHSKIVALTDWSMIHGLQVHQIFHNGKLVFNAIESTDENIQKQKTFITLSIILLVLAAVTYSIGLVVERKIRN